MERIVAFLLARALFKSATLASQSEFDHIRRLWRIAAAHLDDSLHVHALGSDQSSGDLEILIVLDLNIKPTGILDC